MAEQQAARTRRFFHLRGRTIHLMGRSVDLPASRIARIVIGILLLIGGCLSFLPILGVWMLPLGFMVLSIDIALVRRWRRRSEVRWSRWRASRRVGSIEPSPSEPAAVQTTGTDPRAAGTLRDP